MDNRAGSSLSLLSSRGYVVGDELVLGNPGSNRSGQAGGGEREDEEEDER